ncbi:MAG: hypothetical protein JWN60_1493 [Acidobacteria bacterium]|jgi:hypothetical protein|nr:hypothetical protein [Acidobacteriota bacterium]
MNSENIIAFYGGKEKQKRRKNKSRIKAAEIIFFLEKTKARASSPVQE